MNQKLCREIVTALSVHEGAQYNFRTLQNATPGDWEPVLDWLDLSGIALVFYSRRKALGEENTLPSLARNRLAASLAENEERTLAMAQEFGAINNAFKDAGVPCTVLKGFSLFPDYCPEASLRPTYDYDFLVADDFAARARFVLENRGYVYKAETGKQHSLNFIHETALSSRSQSHTGLYAASLRRKVELHTSLWEPDAFEIPFTPPADWQHRPVAHRWQGLEFDVLPPAVAFLFQGLHIFQHLLHNWCRLGWFWEMAYFLKRHKFDDELWACVVDLVEDDRQLLLVIALVTSLAGRLFSAPLPRWISEVLTTPSNGWVNTWIERYGLNSALENFAGNKYSLFLYREFIQDDHVWQRVKNSRLLPFHRPNHASGAACRASKFSLPSGCRQTIYIIQRLVHHSAKGAGYLLESLRWNRLRRSSSGCTSGNLPSQ